MNRAKKPNDLRHFAVRGRLPQLETTSSGESQLVRIQLEAQSQQQQPSTGLKLRAELGTGELLLITTNNIEIID